MNVLSQAGFIKMCVRKEFLQLELGSAFDHNCLQHTYVAWVHKWKTGIQGILFHLIKLQRIRRNTRPARSSWDSREHVKEQSFH